jgi:23S rRNA (uracil1939-C5)-methyltransferase
MEFVPTDIAHGGEAVARVDGKAYFVAGAIPGERVAGEVVVDKGAWGRVRLLEVVTPAPERIDPPCPHFSRCGGCQWQFVDHPTQLGWKTSVVAGQLAHLGKVADPPVRDTLAMDTPFGYRNRMDFVVDRDRPALYRPRSRRTVQLDLCLLLRPELAAVFARLGDLTGVHRLTLRAGVTTGELLAVVGGRIPAQAPEWGCAVAQTRRGAVHAIHGASTIHEVIDGVRFRITGRAFFQSNTAGAAVLVRLAAEAADLTPDDTLLDAYAGGGLFGATVGRGAGRVVAIESDQVAFRDLRTNLRTAGLADHQAIHGTVETVIAGLDEYWDVAIVDPPREGLREAGVAAVTAARPRTIVVVSCDPASLGRDTRLLQGAGYRLEWAAPVDLFPQTYHVETVARFARDD